LHVPTIKPLDVETILKEAQQTGRMVVVAENHSVIGGLGGAVCETLADHAPCLVKRAGFPDVFMESGDDNDIFAGFGIDVNGVVKQVQKLLTRKDSRN